MTARMREIYPYNENSCDEEIISFRDQQDAVIVNFKLRETGCESWRWT
jgi:hypothetical protein